MKARRNPKVDPITLSVVRGVLELADVAYVGSGVLGSAANMDKVMSKVVATAAGLPIVRHLAVRDVDVAALVLHDEVQRGAQAADDEDEKQDDDEFHGWPRG